MITEIKEILKKGFIVGIVALLFVIAIMIYINIIE